MDTPKKTTQIGTPISKSKFEESPVFNYINSLSPIKPVKSIPIAQTFSSLSFASPPSVFTSPHINSHKESRFFRSHNASNPSKPEVSSRDVSKASEEIEAPGNFDTDASMAEEASIEPASDSFEMELPQILKYDCSTPGHDTSPCATETNNMSLGPSAPQGDNGSPEVVGMDLKKMCNIQGKNETPDWESLISDSTELLIFSSPNDSEAFRGLIQRASVSEARFCSDAVPRLQPDTNNFANDNPSSRENNESKPSATLPYETVSNLHRGLRRRCLDFEVPGAQSKQTLSNNNKLACDPSSRCIFPSIGLHLNAIAMSTRDSKTSFIHETSFSGKIQISLPVSSAPVHSRDMGQETLAQAETETGEDTSQAVEQFSTASAGEELNPSSPKKKRRKFEEAGEGESCKRCNCKKSKCLKLYCECFAAGVYCIEPCSCVDCFNKPIHEDTVLATRKQIESRNPLAFAPKVIRSSELTSEAGDDSSKTPASARHKRGCNCKKSNCLKKYCECYQGGVGCSVNCRCEGCKNAFGRKDGSSMVGMEGEQEEENETSEKSRTAKTVQNNDPMNEEEQNPGSGLPSTPLPLYIQPLVQVPVSSNRPPPRSILGATGSSSGLFSSQTFRKPDIVSTQSRFDKSFEAIAEDRTEDMPEILIRSPIATITTVSPNSKRVSPPHLDSSGSIPGRRGGGRKLILQSIPSFPALN